MELKTNRRHFLRNSAAFIGGLIACPVVLYAQQNIQQSGPGTGTSAGTGTGTGATSGTATGSETISGSSVQTPMSFDPNNPFGPPQQARIWYSVDSTRVSTTNSGVFYGGYNGTGNNNNPATGGRSF